MSLDKSKVLTDQMIRNELQGDINNRILNTPDLNRLYVVFVEDNVVVHDNAGNSSQGIVLGYHSAFAGKDAAGRAVDLHYVVIPYHGGTVKNLALSGLSQIDSLTAATSHEIAEAATDPDIGYKTPGWFDRQRNQEIGDIPNNEVVYLNGSAVECLADQKDRAMTPMGVRRFGRSSSCCKTTAP